MQNKLPLSSLDEILNEVTERHVVWVDPADQFQVDFNNTRPGWTGNVANMVTGGNQSRNHIIAFEVIQNDVINILNSLIVNFTAMEEVRLIDLAESLFLGGPANEINNVQDALTNVLDEIRNGNTANYNASARHLLSVLNSSTANVRVGDSGLNGSIGYNIDADFVPGTSMINENVATVNGVANYNGEVLMLTPHHNAIVFNYQEHCGLTLSFVLSGIGGALYPGTPHGMQLSSTQLPQVGPPANYPYPVLVRDPAGVALPYLYE